MIGFSFSPLYRIALVARVPVLMTSALLVCVTLVSCLPLEQRDHTQPPPWAPV